MNDELEKELAVLEILESETPFQYPEGSIVVFAGNFEVKDGNVSKSFYCCWYDKVGIGFPRKNIVWNPSEWGKLTLEEVNSIRSMFAKSIVWNFHIVKPAD